MARITTHGVSDYSDFVIDEIVARCSDDLHGAVKTLLLINEHLQAKLNYLRMTGMAGRMSSIRLAALTLQRDCLIQKAGPQAKSSVHFGSRSESWTSSSQRPARPQRNARFSRRSRRSAGRRPTTAFPRELFSAGVSWRDFANIPSQFEKAIP